MAFNRMQAILDYLRKNNGRFIEELSEYLRFPSVSAQPQHAPDMARCAEWLVAHARNIGLQADLHRTDGHPVVLARTKPGRSGKKPHFVVYGHYDVQPAEPFELWKTDPFTPTIRGRSLFARGSSDNKGQNFAHFKAVEAYLKTGSEIPCDITFLIEGEEEVGSGHLEAFLKKHRRELRCAAVVISDTGMPDKQHPALTYALRGVLAVEVRLQGPSRDLHSGLYGGTVDNPAMVLCQMLASLRDEKGRVTIPGFYRDVRELSKYERRQFARFPVSTAQYRKMTGAPRLFGERGYSIFEQRAARPTIEINGLTSGYQGAGSKTIIPAWASAKLTFRLVPDQNPKRIFSLIGQHLKRLCPDTVRMEITDGHFGEPYLVSPQGKLSQAALKTLGEAFGHEPIMMREGGSIPIVTALKRILKADSLLLGLGLPDDNPHSPNEKFDLDCFEAGMRMSALLWPELSRAAK